MVGCHPDRWRRLQQRHSLAKRKQRQILLRHDNFQSEANITGEVHDFLTLTGLALRVEENPPSDTARRAVDPAFFFDVETAFELWVGRP